MTPRTRTQRRADTIATLQRGGDVWVASANTNGTAHLVALTYLWEASD